MADGGGDNNKVIISLDLEAGVFKSSIAGVETTIDNLGQKAEGAGKKSGMAWLEVNAIMEIGTKIIETMHQALEAMERSEAIKNQGIALKNFASEYGVNAEKLTEIIKKSSHDTVTDIEAQRTAFTLLQAGVQAQAIPTFVEFAKKLEEARGVPFAETINKLGVAVETGSGRMQKFGLSINAAGDVMSRQTSLVEQMENQMTKMGTGYENTAEKIKVKTQETKDRIMNFVGTAFSSTFLQDFGDKHAQMLGKLQQDEQQLAAIKKNEQDGERSYLKEFMSLEGVYMGSKKSLEEDIAKIKGTLAEADKKETAEIKEQTNELTQQKNVLTVLSAEQQKKAAVAANVHVLEARAADEQTRFGATSLETEKQLFSAKRTRIEEASQQELADLAKKPQTYKHFAEEVERIEAEKFAKIQELRVTDQQFAEESEAAKLASIEHSDNMAFANAQNKEAIQVEMEKSKYDRELEGLRQKGLDREQFHQQMEMAEQQHQQRLAAITNQYSKVNSANFKLGWNQAMTQLGSQFNNFSNIVQRSTAKSHSIMTNAFVQAAKGHGNAMELMKQQFLEMIGTEMIQSGIYHLLMGIWPPNPIELGMGAGLVAAGSALVGASGGADASGGGGGGGDFAGGGTGMSGPAQAQQSQLERKSASITIMGDYLNSRETQMHLADVLRSNSDVTDYAIVAQGKTF